MDSWPIAHELEKRYPSPSLHLDDPIVVQIRDHISKLMEPIFFFLIPRVPLLLNKPSADFYNETRQKTYGAPLEEVEKANTNEQCWEQAKAPAKEAGDLLRKNGGPFFLGETGEHTGFMDKEMFRANSGQSRMPT